LTSKVRFLPAILVKAIASTGCGGSGSPGASAVEPAQGPPAALKKEMEEGKKVLMANKKKPRSVRPPLGPLK
jgi:hypothetical protein